MRVKKVLVLLVAVMLVACILTGCNPEHSSGYFKYTQHKHDETGEKLARITESDCITKWDFKNDTMQNEELNLYAKWTKK